MENGRGFSAIISKRVCDITEKNIGSMSLVMDYIKTFDEKRKVFKINKLPKKDIDVLIKLDIARHLNGVLCISTEDVAFKEFTNVLPIETKKTEFIYIASDGSGLHKIGYTKATKKLKEKSMRTYNPNIKIIHMGVGTIYDERDLHGKFADKRKVGEWFDLTEADIEWIKSNYKVA